MIGPDFFRTDDSFRVAETMMGNYASDEFVMGERINFLSRILKALENICREKKINQELSTDDKRCLDRLFWEIDTLLLFEVTYGLDYLKRYTINGINALNRTEELYGKAVEDCSDGAFGIVGKEMEKDLIWKMNTRTKSVQKQYGIARKEKIDQFFGPLKN